MENYDDFEIIIEESSDKVDQKELTTYSYISNGLCFEYFIGYEIASLLGYKSPKDTITHNVSKSNQLSFRDYPGVKEPIIDPRVILITRDGAIELLIKTRKRLTPDILHMFKEFGIDTTNRKCLTKEQQTLSAIANTFKTEKIEDQFKIGKYYLDMYFPEYKIVVECDENGHADRKPYKERERMDYVNKEFDINDTHWMRYNPDEHDFDISKVIGRIYNRIILIKKEQEEKNLSELEIKLKNTKHLSLFEQKSVNINRKVLESCVIPEIKCIDTDRVPKKKCTKCYLNLSLNEYYIRGDLPDIQEIEVKKLKEYTEKELEYIRSKFRSSCKKCQHESNRITKEKYRGLGANQECVDCKKILHRDLFYLNIDGSRFVNCIECYKKKNNLSNCKQCSSCKDILELSRFQTDLSHSDGLRGQCKTCRNQKAKESRLKRKEKVNESVISEFCNEELSNKK